MNLEKSIELEHKWSMQLQKHLLDGVIIKQRKRTLNNYILQNAGTTQYT